jgi:DNA-directed RNA polymerase subunit N (RpoN/RPB10)
MKLNCLSCGHSVDLHHDYDDYEGQVKCFVCGALLTILTEGGHIKRVTLSLHVMQDNDTTLHSVSS